jgi:hypothetical protein
MLDAEGLKKVLNGKLIVRLAYDILGNSRISRHFGECGSTV